MNQAEHDRRVSELLAANNREVERRRKAERECAALMKALRDAEGYLRADDNEGRDDPGDIRHNLLVRIRAAIISPT